MTINKFDRPREAINLFKNFMSFNLKKLRIYQLCNSAKKGYTRLNLPFWGTVIYSNSITCNIRVILHVCVAEHSS